VVFRAHSAGPYPPRVFSIFLWNVRTRFQWPRGLRRGCAAARLLGLRVRILLWVWRSISCEVFCVVRYRSVRQADHSSRGVPPSVVYLSVIMGPMRTWPIRGYGAVKKMSHERKNAVLNFLILHKIHLFGIMVLFSVPEWKYAELAVRVPNTLGNTVLNQMRQMNAVLFAAWLGCKLRSLYVRQARNHALACALTHPQI
jgi:hypothetical protein